MEGFYNFSILGRAASGFFKEVKFLVRGALGGEGLSWIFFPSCSKMQVLDLPKIVALKSKIHGLLRRMLPTSIGIMSYQTWS